MSRVRVKKKPRKQGAGLYGLSGSDRIFVGKDWALQNDIDEAKVKTKERACFRACRTCGACANSRRGASYPYRFDANSREMINCKGCEPFRFHDCENGKMRDARQEAEPFTEDAEKYFKKGGKPLV